MNINILKDSKTDSKQPKVYDLGTITSTLQALLNVSSITITDEQTIILKITDLDSNINYYLLPLKDYKGSTIYGLGKDIQASDLISISGSGTAQGNRAPLAVNANRVFTLEDRTKNLYSLFDLSTTVSLTLNNSVAYDLGDVLKIQHYVGVDGSEASTMNLVFDYVTVFYGNDLITSFSIPYGAVAYLEKILPSVWTLSYKLAQDIGGSVTPSTLISTDADNALVVGTDSKLFVPESTGGGVESVTGANVDNTDPLNPVVNPTPINASGGGTTITDGVIEHNDLVALGSVSANGRTRLSENLIDAEAGLYYIDGDKIIATYSETDDKFYYGGNGFMYDVATGTFEVSGNIIGYVKVGVDDPTTVVLTSSDLNTNYPASPTGFKVYCVSIIVGAMVYEKTPSGWIGTACIIP